MTTFARALIVLLLCIAGCADTDPSVDPSASSGPEETSSSTPGSGPDSSPAPDSDGVDATSVSYTRSGGLRPTKLHVVFAADQPPPEGYTQADVDQILRTASDPRFRDLQMEPMPANPCCDLYSFNVTITWEGGQTRTFSSVDGVDQPALFDKLLRDIA